MSAQSQAMPSPISRARTSSGTALRFDWVMALLGLWIIGGLHLDAWAHIHFPQLETFFTPWHAVLYSGVFMTVGVLAVTAFRKGRWALFNADSLPLGYGHSLVGAVLFLIAGATDMVWHLLFGIEADVEALVSPTHLALFVTGAIAGLGPLRAAWAQKRTQAGWRDVGPMVLTLVFLMSLLTFTTQYVHLFGGGFAALAWRNAGVPSFFLQALGLVAAILQSALLMGPVLLTLRRTPLPFGSLTVIVGVNIALLTLMRQRLIPMNIETLLGVAVAAGLVGDVLLARLRPWSAGIRNVRLFAFSVPAVLYGLYFTALAATVGTWWSWHLMSGAVVLAGLSGWLVSYLVFSWSPE